ncbi:MAG: hypothetical protein V3U27_17260, partial [Candidatus Tectomicrobia bacterium]
MNTLFAPDQPLCDPMQRIVADLRDCSRAHVVLAIVNDTALQREAIAELGEQLSGQYALYDFDYAHTEQLSLPRFCRTLRHDLPLCVFAYGLETLSEHDKDNY